MTDRENLINLFRRKGYEKMPVNFNMTPDLEKRFKAYCKKTGFKCPEQAFVNIPGTMPKKIRTSNFWEQFYEHKFKPGTTFDIYGVANEPGSEACYHMTRMHHPLENMTELDELMAYPFPELVDKPTLIQKSAVKKAHAKGRFALGNMQCTVWETAWYARGMEVLMMDMMSEPELAEFVLDKVTDNAIINATNYAKAGADGLFLGDDIGMQSSIMMSLDLYREFLKPRLKRVVDAARAINPEIIILYHSCGYVTPFIPDLIDAGVDVLNPVQPESMNFEEIYKEYGNNLSFCGTLGTQTLMPFGKPEEIKETLNKYLDMVGPKGGLLACPTHILEPEVPIENVVAYIEACKEYQEKNNAYIV